MKKSIALLAALVALSAAAKTTTTEITEWNSSSSESRYTDGVTQVFVRPVTVNAVPIKKTVIDENGKTKQVAIRVSYTKTITGDEYSSRLSYFENKGELDVNTEQSEINLKNYVLYLATVGRLKDNDSIAHPCDVFLAPLFNMSLNQDKAVIEFTGFPALFEDWGVADAAEYNAWIYSEERNPKITGVKDAEARTPVGIQEKEVIRTSSPLDKLTGK